MRRYLLLILLAIGLGLPTSSSATLVKTFSMPELVYEAHDVVRGYVTSMQAVYDPHRKHVYTHTTVTVVEDLRTGDKKERIVVIRQLGGSADGIVTTLTGNATLDLGEEVVIFARTDGVFHYMLGMSQGKYSVVRALGKTPHLQRTHNGIHGLKRSPMALPQAPDALALKALRAQVKAYAKKEARP